MKKKDGIEWKSIGVLPGSELETNRERVQVVRLEADHFYLPSHAAQPLGIYFLSTLHGTG